MQTYFDCLPCLVRQTLEAVRKATRNEQIQEQVLRTVLRETAALDLHQSPPVMGARIHQIIAEITGIEDPYAEDKARSNTMALALYPKLKRQVVASADPLDTAIRLAAAGNIIDFGVRNDLTDEMVDSAIEHALAAELDTEGEQVFREKLKKAKRILYIADNAGEIVFDRILIETFPSAQITVGVRGAPIINDVTRADAAIAGFSPDIAIVDSGLAMPGTVLEQCSAEFQDCFTRADLIIAKGQGNYETLSGNQSHPALFLLLKAKCPMIARHIGCRLGDIVLAPAETTAGIR